MEPIIPDGFRTAVAGLTAGSINQLLSSELGLDPEWPKDGTCCPECCAPCSALRWLRDNGIPVGQWLADAEMGGYDWQQPDNTIDWELIAQRWTMTDCHTI